MKETLSKAEKELLQSRNPNEYIDRSVKSRLASGRKAMITRIWMDKKGYTIDDIKFARNRHPYWKKKKMDGTAERNQQRFENHDYSKGVSLVWNDKLIDEFISLNAKDKSGVYLKKDWELAKKFKCTIASIQHMRRKSNMASRIIEREGGKGTQKKMRDLISMSESVLRAMNGRKRK
jgi:hypothetical protein